MSPKTPSLVGQRFGKIVVVSEGPKTSEGRSTVNLECDCGTKKTVRIDSMSRSKRPKSCGCPLAPPITSAFVKIENGHVLYEAYGRWQTMNGWAAESGISQGTLDSRVRQYGRTMLEALTMARVRRGDFAGRRAS